MEFLTHGIYLPWDGNPYASSDQLTCIWFFTHSRIAARFGCIDSRSSSYLCQSSFVRSAGWYWALSTIAFWSDCKTVRACRVDHQDKKNVYQTFVEKHNMTWGRILWENSNSCLFTLRQQIGASRAGGGSLVPPFLGRLCLHVVFRDAVSKFF